MPTYSALTTLPAKEPAEALAEAMENFLPEPTGIGVFEIEDGSGDFEVGVYFEEEPDAIELALLAAIYGAKPFVVSEVPQTDWVAHVKRELQPVEAGRFFVYGSHDAERVPADRVALLIEAAMAFGTGHHGTTKGCLLALDRLDRAGFRGRRVADIGCGTAVLAMAAASIWPEPVIASDIDAVAVEVAKANVEANGLGDRVTCVEAAGFDHPELAARAPYDLVFANILKGPLIQLAPEMASAIAPDGYAILSGLLTTQADEVIAAYKTAGFVLVSRDEIAEWATLVLKRRQIK
ncbi:50S ribosomal protein L11 methyltransferase [Defluviimonas sp. WL0024]|uniref:Ribosomal protein L11 methyltransferase n=2 Tax=Albidovulum TaxID=205889 RepID=A0ABT3J8D3_9RHOB|nr:MULTISPECIES: 50S ribosomal protein L11 methyltransferase [Defluviimonas]MCU9847338.1 50S ribosomal protein L11 methyltransferase [Defluviimonas sp. WL0024]MCW3783948.1 50S ribosomal protein L11 methyltransferase [Defluviimonas salinarum]